MPEEKPKPTENVTDPVTPSPVKPDSENLIQKANEAAERLEKANELLEKHFNKLTELKIEETLGGSARAGDKKLTKEEQEITETKKLLRGTGFEHILDESE